MSATATATNLSFAGLSVARGGPPGAARRLDHDPAGRGHRAARAERRREVDPRARGRRRPPPHRRHDRARRRRADAAPPRADPHRGRRDRPRGAPAASRTSRSRTTCASRPTRSAARRRATAIAYALELFPELEKRWRITARSLSGGEQQMVVLAQALVSRPQFVLVDELSLGLAPIIVQRLVPTLEAVAESGVGVLLIEQFAHVALGARADRVRPRARADPLPRDGAAAQGRARAAPVRLPAARRRPGGGRDALVGGVAGVPPETAAGTVQTVRGPVAAADLGRTLPHEHIVVLQPEALQNYGHVWGASYWDEDDRRPRRDREAPRGPRRGHPDARRPDRARARPLHPPHPADQRRGRPQHRRRDGRLRVPRAAELPPLPKRRGDRRAVRARDPGGDRRHRGQGGVPQVRRRGARPRRRHPEDPRRRRDRGARDGRAGDGAHERERRDGHARARGADEPRRRPRPDRRRARGRQQRPPVPAGDRATPARSLGFDRFNIPHFNPDADRIRTLLALLEEGYGDRIHLSHDAACFFDFMVGDPNFADERPDYLHLSTQILPVLREHGVTRGADRRADDRQPAALPRPCRGSPLDRSRAARRRGGVGAPRATRRVGDRAHDRAPGPHPRGRRRPQPRGRSRLDQRVGPRLRGGRARSGGAGGRAARRGGRAARRPRPRVDRRPDRAQGPLRRRREAASPPRAASSTTCRPRTATSGSSFPPRAWCSSAIYTRTSSPPAGRRTRSGVPGRSTLAPGGSSGGSAAALAARMAPAADRHATPPARCASRPPAAARLRSSPPAVSSRSRGSCRWRGPSTTPVRWPAPLADCADAARGDGRPGRRSAESALHASCPTRRRSAGARPLAGARLAVSPRLGSVELDSDVAAGFDRRAPRLPAARSLLVEPPTARPAPTPSGTTSSTCWRPRCSSTTGASTANATRYRPSLREWVETGERRAVSAEDYVAAQAPATGADRRLGRLARRAPRRRACSSRRSPSSLRCAGTATTTRVRTTR